MPLMVFLLLAAIFMIGTSANIAGNLYGNYLAVLAMSIFSVWMLVTELKMKGIQFAGNRRERWGNWIYSSLLAAYIIALGNLSIDWPYATGIYLLVAFLLIGYRLSQNLLGFLFLILRRTGIRAFGKTMVFTMIDCLFLAQVFMEEMQIMDMRDWRFYANTGFILMNFIFVVQAFFQSGPFLTNLKLRYPASLALSFYLFTIGFVGYQSASDAGYVPKLYYAIFHSPETCRQEAVLLKSGDFEALTRMKFNISSFWNRNGKKNLLMSRQTPFVTYLNSQMNLHLDFRQGVSWENTESENSENE